MALLILFFLQVRRFPAVLLYRVLAAVWVIGGGVMVAAHQPLTSLVYVAFAWCYWLVSMEAAAPGWCRQWLQRLIGRTWHARFDSLCGLLLVGALWAHGWARAWCCLGYLVASGCRYAARPRPASATQVQLRVQELLLQQLNIVPVPPAAPAAQRVPPTQLDVWRAGHAAGLLQGFNLGRNSTPTRPQ